MVDRQAEALAKLVDNGVQPHALILRDPAGKQNPEIRSYTASLAQHAEMLAKRIGGMSVHDLLAVRTRPANDIVSMARDLNADPKTHGAMFMSPMDRFAEAARVLGPERDIDRMGPSWNVDGWCRDPRTGRVITSAIPITAEATQRLLVHHRKIGEGSVVTQFGKGVTVGGPLAASLGSIEGVKLHIIDRSTTDEARRVMLDESDVVIGAVGKPVIRSNELHDGQTVVGVGLDDICQDVYTSGLDIEVTPPHLEDAWGVGRVTSAGYWERVLQNAADFAGIPLVVGGFAVAAYEEYEPVGR